MTTPKTLTAQIIIIGDELLNGSISDANMAPIASWLLFRGIHLQKALTVRDQRPQLAEAIQSAWNEADIVITTGGLGPTKDDITKSILGEMVGGELVENLEAIELVSAQYKKMNKEWRKESNLYHLIPEGVGVFRNPIGLAPGLKIQKAGKLLLATPGVPRELMAMIKEEFSELIKETFNHFPEPEQRISIRTKGIPEEKIFFEMMPELWSHLETYGKVSSLPQLLGVDIHLQFAATPEKKAQIEEALRLKLASSPLAPYIWHWGEESIEELIIKMATQKNITLGISESCTGGLVAHRLTSVAGSSQVFLGSLVTYANEAKMNILDVKEETLAAHGAVSCEVATQMASGARRLLKADISVSLTGIAGPGGGSTQKPVGTVCLGEASPSGEKAVRLNFFGNRHHLKRRFSQAALFKLHELIETF